MSDHTHMPAKRPYAAPALVVHGDLRALTQAGSAGVIESKSANTGGAQCGSVVKKRC
jgi:hypothetical protein